MIFITSNNRLTAVSTFAIAMSTLLPAYAQAFDNTTVSDKDINKVIDEIVVTAQKREQRLNEVGLTLSVFSGAEIDRRRITSQQDLAAIIPGLSYTNSANGTPVFTLRGIGFYETSLAAYPTVSSYIDEMPLAFPILGAHAIYDIERVEILKGPQGTLFGQNATGGAINYIAAKPTEDLQGGINLTYGRFNHLAGEAYISGPLSDVLAARVSLRVEDGDGWQVSDTRTDDRNGKRENYKGRVQLAYTPSETARFLLNVNGWVDKSDTQAPQYIALQPQNAVISDILANSALSTQTPRSADWTPGMTHRDNSLWQTSLRMDINVNPNILFSSLTSYVDYNQEQGNDGDGIPASTLDLPTDNGEIKSFAQEVRLSSMDAHPWQWVLGANYERSNVDQVIDVFYPDNSFPATFGPVFGYIITGAHYSSEQDMENYAFFGNVDYQIRPSVTLKAGMRYTKAKTDSTNCNSDTSGLPTDVGPFFFDLLLGGAFGPYAGQCFVINNLTETVNGVAPFAPGAYGSTLDEDNVSWRVGIDVTPKDDVLIYANVARGYKAGGFPTLSASVFSQYLPVSQETLLSYEAGFKAALLQKTVQLNGAVFYYDYTDKQLRSKTIDPLFGVLDILQNIPKSKVKGIELELRVQPLTGLNINAAFTYMDSEIQEFTGINAAGLSADFAGTRVPFTPKYQGGINIDYDFPVSDELNASIGASFNARSSTVAVVGGDITPANVTPNNFKVFGIKSYAVLDLRASLYAADDSWRISLWGKNITNTYYWNNVVTAYDTVARYASPPATWGMTAGYKF